MDSKMINFYYHLEDVIHDIKKEIARADEKMDTIELEQPDDFNKILGNIRHIQSLSDSILDHYDNEF